MSVEIRVPPLGESVVEATVGRWAKKAGETVAKGELVVELETDKINVEVSAPGDGVLGAIAKEEGTTVGVNDLLGTVEGGGSAAPAKEAGKAAAPAAEPAPSPTAKSEDGAQTSPAARAIAAEHGIDLGSLKGSGPNGRITKEDVLKAAEAKTSAPAAAPAAPAPAAPTAPPRAAAPPSAPAAPAQPAAAG